MPEGSECRLIADVIAKGVGLEFDGAEIVENLPGKDHRFSRKLPDRWLELQQKWTLAEVKTKGKLITIRVSLPKEDIYILNTLGLSGTWAWDQNTFKHTKLVFNSNKDLCFIDQLGYGTLRLTNKETAQKANAKIGWDLLTSPAPKELWANFKINKKIVNKPIGEILLEQNLFSGLGNIYKAELIFRLGINPLISVSSLSNEQWEKLNQTAHEVLQEAYKLGGSSIEHFEADGVKGKAQDFHKIYGKDTCPLGHKVSKIKQATRTSWFCSTCQPEIK